MKQKFSLLMTALLIGLTSWAQVPKADLLDVVFNDDGTATDVSAYQNTVELMGEPNVVKSSKYGINVACFHANTLAASCNYWYKVEYGSKMEFTEDLADGHSLEVLCRMELPGDYTELVGASQESKPFSSHQGGGTGFMVCKKTSSDAVEDGTSASPYKVKNVSDLLSMSSKMKPGQVTYFKLTSDIDMTGCQWTPLNMVDRYANWIDLNGDGHVIKNMTLNNAQQDYNSFFGVFCGDIRNIGFENAYVTCQATGSGILGGYVGHEWFCDESGQPYTSHIENVYVTGKVENSSGSYCGGMFGTVGGPTEIKNCYVNVEVIGCSANTGGIVARTKAELTVTNCFAAGSTNLGGGIVGTTSAPATFNNVTVWNNTNSNFGAPADGNVLTNISYFDGSNFAELQKIVVAYDPSIWTCDNADGSYPTLNFKNIAGVPERDNEWTFLPHIGGSYVYANSGVKAVGGEYVHLVGVYDKAKGEARIYVNGELKYVNPNATGDMTMSSLTYFVVGGDPSNGGANSAFKGDVAIARVYGDPLTDDQVASLYGAVQAMDTGQEEHVDEVVYDPYIRVTESNNNIQMTELEEPYSYELVTVGDDPYIQLSPLQKKLGSDETVVTFEYKCNVDAPSEFFFSPAAAGREINFTIPAAEDWTPLYVDLTDPITSFSWGNINDNLRLDVGVSAGITLDIRNIHFITRTEYLEMFGVDLNLPKDDDGWYTVSTPEELVTLAEAVNGGNFRSVNVRLADNIDLGGMDWRPIGTGGCYNKVDGPAQVANPGFSGVFDGQGYTISNFVLNEGAGGEAIGLFGVLTGTVRNLGVSGAMFNATLDCRAGALAGSVVATSLSSGLVENCYVINSSILTTDRVCGGVVGSVSGGTVQNCYGLYNELSGHGDRFGGIAGDTKNDNGWVGTVINCYTDHARVTSSQSGNTSNSQGGVSAERFQSGEIAYKLNGITSIESAWRQNIGEDLYPVLDPSHGLVMPAGNQYISISEDNFTSVRDEIVAEESEFNANTICAYDLTDSYEEMLTALGDASTIEEFFQAYSEVAELKELLIASAQSYAAYQAKIDEVNAYLEENTNFAGPDRELLENYLTETVDPDENFPNGSYDYIMTNRLLNNDDLAAEITFVQTLLDMAVENGYTEGADITNLLTNADFSDGTTGWTIEGGSLSVSKAGDAGVKFVGESSNTINLSQTLTGLMPGFYQVKVNAAYRAAGDNNNLNQASFLYANNDKVYLSTMREGMISAEAGSPYVDRYTAVEDQEGNCIGYLPTSATAFGYAFGEGYYQSTIITEVGEDGTLTLGITTPGCNKTNTTWVGAFQVIYCGAADTEYSQTGLDETLENQAARLSTLAYEYTYDDFDFAAAPNYSEALKAEVQAQAESATSASDKYAKVVELGKLMQEVYECKQAYAGMMAQAEIILDLYSNLANADMLTDDEAILMDQAYTTISDAYLDGSYSKEEALEANPFAALPFMPTIEGNVAKIDDARELMVFSAMVNSGFYPMMNAVLESDIDLAGADWRPIGTGNCYNKVDGPEQVTNPGFTAVFDGQGHTVSNFNIVEGNDADAIGFFGIVTGTVRNLGIIGVSFNATKDCRAGGIAGSVVASTTSAGLIENCYVINSSILAPDRVCGGVVGAVSGGTVQNCYGLYNELSGHADRFGGIAGDTKNDNGWVGTVSNCYTDYSSVTSSQSGNTYNCQGGVSSARFKSGEIAYLLNGGVTEGEGLVWYQTIMADESPVLDKTHYVVRLTENGSYTNFDDTNAALLALVNEARSLAASIKMTDHEVLITSGDQLSDNCLWNNEAQYRIQNIIDGDPATYFHSRTDTDLSLGTEYFQVNLPCAVQGFYLEYMGRSDGAAVSGAVWHDTPDKLRIEGTNTPEDENSWTVLSTEEYEIPDMDGATYASVDPILLGGSYQYIRFYVLHSTHGNRYWNIAEFQMYNAAPSGQSLYESDPEITKTVDEAEACANEKEQKSLSGTGTQADIDELQALVDKLRELTGIVKEHAGTKNDPYEIASAEDFQNLRSKMKTGEMTYVVLTEDIDMSGVENWIPLNDWSDQADGKNWMNWIDFNGRGHVISNLTCTSESGYDYASIFGVLCGNVRNVGFENVNVTCTSTGSGVLGGYMGHSNFTDAEGNLQTSTLENVWVTGTLNVSTSYCGGLIGNIGGPSIIRNCYTNLNIVSEAAYTGGIVGRVRSGLTLQNVYAAGTMNTGGGIVGGGQNDATAPSTYTNCVVWNNTDQNFGATVEADVVTGVSYYDGSNFAALQQTVVGWGNPWTCDMAEGSYPTFDKELITGIQQISISNNATVGSKVNIYALDGRLVKANVSASAVKSLPRGLYIVGGRKVVVK